jgi:hypothetical protein
MGSKSAPRVKLLRWKEVTLTQACRDGYSSRLGGRSLGCKSSVFLALKDEINLQVIGGRQISGF